MFGLVLDVLKKLGNEVGGSEADLGSRSWAWGEIARPRFVHSRVICMPSGRFASSGLYTTASERLHLTNFAFKLSPSSSQREVDWRSLHPFIHRWFNQRSKSSTFRPVSFLDVIPRLLDMFYLNMGDFFAVFSMVGVVTLLSIDTSPNMFTLLKPVWRYLCHGTGTEFERGIWDDRAC